MRLYKLTDSDGQTKNRTQWEPDVTHTAIGEGTALCSNGVLHAYTSPELAVVLNPIHANIKDPQLWEAEGDVVSSDSFKVGCKTLTTKIQCDLPKITTNQKIRFAIYCSQEVFSSNEKWNTWATNWLNKKDRSGSAAYAARAAAHAAHAAHAAYYAAHAADAAYYAARASAAYDAANAAYHATNAASVADSDASATIDFQNLLERAIREEV